MLEYLHLTNVGPSPELTMELGSRLNLITGDNGLGKSFLLDIAWWALTRKWPAQINPRLASGLMARPREGEEGSIELRFTGMTKKETYRSGFDRKAQGWKGRAGRPSNPGLVVYAEADGGISVWDPARNYWLKNKGVDVQERPPAYVFSLDEVWNGLKIDKTVVCTGLLFDWVLWKGLAGEPFAQLVKVLEALSPPGGPVLSPGPLVRIGLESREMPTISMPYGVDVPLVHVSAGMRRVIGLAYILVWAWQEHVFASRELGQPTTKQVVFLVDEIEAHLHPRWQRRILRSLLAVMESMIPHAAVQVVAATHSPLILASAEPFFDPVQDAWFDLDMDQEKGVVSLQKRTFMRRGTAGRWLTSQAFDLRSEGRSLEAERAIEDAERILDRYREEGRVEASEVDAVDGALRASLPDVDRFWIRWSEAVGKLKGAG